MKKVATKAPYIEPQVREVGGHREVLDPVRRRWVTLTPEEEVRQQTIAMLHSTYGYPLELMQVEGAITLNGMTRRCDIVTYDTTGQPHIIVECKRRDVPITQKVCDQACRYNTVLQVPILILTNGIQQVVIAVDREHATLRQLAEIPTYHK
ncbi:MAG: type I restriction enzyme HsdR N-terminal domain-containing protein [Bacteroidales bacterium]|nr:type I restriction enzyme HsdR N-terminal domain-containing protein [Bacteroidales bacterium]